MGSSTLVRKPVTIEAVINEASVSASELSSLLCFIETAYGLALMEVARKEFPEAYEKSLESFYEWVITKSDRMVRLYGRIGANFQLPEVIVFPASAEISVRVRSISKDDFLFLINRMKSESLFEKGLYTPTDFADWLNRAAGGSICLLTGMESTPEFKSMLTMRTAVIEKKSLRGDVVDDLVRETAGNLRTLFKKHDDSQFRMIDVQVDGRKIKLWCRKTH